VVVQWLEVRVSQKLNEENREGRGEKEACRMKCEH
jgi:hypothetical protein